jgi:hypothetical protein
MPTIRLATDADLRQITSQNLVFALPWLYIPDDQPGLMKSWGVARSDGDASVAIWARQHPDALVAPRFQGSRVERAELLFYGAEPTADFPHASGGCPGG